jgi:hypothetical protein
MFFFCRKEVFELNQLWSFLEKLSFSICNDKNQNNENTLGVTCAKLSISLCCCSKQEKFLQLKLEGHLFGDEKMTAKLCYPLAISF